MASGLAGLHVSKPALYNLQELATSGRGSLQDQQGPRRQNIKSTDNKNAGNTGGQWKLLKASDVTEVGFGNDRRRLPVYLRGCWRRQQGEQRCALTSTFQPSCPPPFLTIRQIH